MTADQETPPAVENDQPTEESDRMTDDLQPDTPDNVLDMTDLDIPLPTEADSGVIEDTVDVSYRFCFVGSGQGGSRLAETFYKMGYRRVCVVNSTVGDLARIQVPEENKLEMQGTGAGKDLDRGARYASDHSEDIFDLMSKCFGPSFDRIMVTIGAGGGTGAGSVFTLIDRAKELARRERVETDTSGTKVGVIVALPKKDEGQRPSRNAYKVVVELLKMAGLDGKDPRISPLIIVDNEKIRTIHPQVSVSDFWNVANRSIASLFHLFNVIACKDSQYTSFDKMDLGTILDSGAVTFGATPLARVQDRTDVSKAIRNNLKRNVLSGGFDLATGTVAGCVIIGSGGLLSSIPQEHLDYGFESLSGMLDSNSTVHRGIYEGNRDELAIYTIIGGLGTPSERLVELAKVAGVKPDFKLKR